MRGSHVNLADLRRDAGIIPAHAGLTAPNVHGPTTTRDHPRACGAHQESPETIGIAGGSSPRMRGSPLLVFERDAQRGIIPAHAGLTGRKKA